jgi:glutathione S-transferase
VKLRYSPTSPYARKVRAVAVEKGLDDRLALVATDTWDLPEVLLHDNPLGKIPTLITDDGAALYDSAVICEYLDAVGAGPTLFPGVGPRRWHALRLQALGDGMMDAAVERYVEGMRPPERRLESWSQRRKAAIDRCLDHLDQISLATEPEIGEIAIACALGYLDLRFAADAWRDGRNRLAAWYERFARRPSMATTRPPI